MDEELLQTQERMMGESEGQRGRVAWRNGGVPVGAVTLLLLQREGPVAAQYRGTWCVQGWYLHITDFPSPINRACAGDILSCTQKN